MKDLFVPGSLQFDALCLFIMAVGAFLVAAFTQVPTHWEALKNLLYGLIGGFILYMLATGQWEHMHMRFQLAVAGVSGLCGNWAIHKLFNSRDGWWKKADSHLMGGDDKTE